MVNIRTSRKSGFVTRGGVRRRETLWFSGTAMTVSPSAPSTATLLASLNAAALALRPFTVVRVRGIIHIQSDQAAATERQSLGYGLAVVSEQAVAIGVTAIPTPVTDDGSDLWFVYQRVMSSLAVVSAASAFEIGKVFEFDSKAMRKVEDGQDLVEVQELDVAGVTLGATVTTYSRILIKIH